MNRRIVIATLLSLAVGVILFSVLFARAPDYDSNRNRMIDNTEAVAGAQDYFNGHISQEEALDLFLRYFASIPLDDTTSAATPRPAQTPIPISTPRPQPDTSILECEARKSGLFATASHVNNILEVVHRVARDVEVSFINPNGVKWEYGLEIQELGNQRASVLFFINNDGEWHLEGINRHFGYGNLARSEIPFYTQKGESNQITFRTERRDRRGGVFYVNGYRVTSTALYAPNSNTTYKRLRDERRYYLYADRATRYEGLCTQDAW